MIARQKSRRYIDWAHLTKLFPDYAEHIFRIRKNPKALYWLKHRLVHKYGLKREKLLLEEAWKSS